MSARTGGSVLIANPGADLYGSDRMVLETVEAALEAGWHVVVAVPHDGPLVPELSSRGASLVHCPTPVVRKTALRPTGALRLLRDIVLGVRPAVALLRRVRPDVLYVSTITAPLWLVLGRMMGCRVVCHIHEGEASAPRALLRALNAPLFLAHQLLINSRFSRDVLARAFPALARRTEVVYNSVPGPERPEPARPALDGGCRLLYVGRLSPRKGPDVALAALAVLRARGVRATLDLVGAVFPGYEWFDAQLAQQVRDGGLADAVTFHGFQRDVWPYLAAADVVLVPSTVDEPFGNTAVEAALAARPSVVSDLAGLKEARFGLSAAIPVPPADAAAIADAVEAIIADWPGFRARAADDAGFAATRYSRKTYADTMLALFEDVRSRPSRRRS